MKKHKVVMDANVITSALRSRNSFYFKLFSIIDDERIKVFISVPVILEYEDAVKRDKANVKLRKAEIDDILNFICFIAEQRKIYYLWRPFLRDAKNDMFLELAVESECDYIIIFNKRDYEGVESFGIKVITPKEFIKVIGEKYE